MTVEAMREKLMTLYGPAWQEKARGFPDKQVIAVYYKFLETGAFDKKKLENDGIQLSMYDYISQK